MIDGTKREREGLRIERKTELEKIGEKKHILEKIG